MQVIAKNGMTFHRSEIGINPKTNENMQVIHESHTVSHGATAAGST